MNNYVISEDVAVSEVKKFVEYHTDKPVDDDTINDQYPSVVSSVMKGLLVLSDMDKPVLALREPIKTEAGAIDVDKIEFKTRIVSSTYQSLAKGLDMKRDSMKFANVITAYLCDLGSTAYLDKFPNKHDFKTIQQITSLFT